MVKGLGDLGACRTDVIFMCLIYPVGGIVLTRLTFGYQMPVCLRRRINTACA